MILTFYPRILRGYSSQDRVDKLVNYFDFLAAFSALVVHYVLAGFIVIITYVLVVVSYGDHNLLYDPSVAESAVLTSGQTGVVAISLYKLVVLNVLRRMLVANVAFEYLEEFYFAANATYMVYSGCILVYEILAPSVSLFGGLVNVDLAVLIALAGELADTGGIAGCSYENLLDTVVVVGGNLNTIVGKLIVLTANGAIVNNSGTILAVSGNGLGFAYGAVFGNDLLTSGAESTVRTVSSIKESGNVVSKSILKAGLLGYVVIATRAGGVNALTVGAISRQELILEIVAKSLGTGNDIHLGFSLTTYGTSHTCKSRRSTGCVDNGFYEYMLTGSRNLLGVAVALGSSGAYRTGVGLNTSLAAGCGGGDNAVIVLVRSCNSLGVGIAANGTSEGLNAILQAGCRSGDLTVVVLVSRIDCLISASGTAILTCHLCYTVLGAGSSLKNACLNGSVVIGINGKNLNLSILINYTTELADHFDLTLCSAGCGSGLSLVGVLKSIYSVSLLGLAAGSAGVQSVTLNAALGSEDHAVIPLVTNSATAGDLGVFGVGVIATGTYVLNALCVGAISGKQGLGVVVTQSNAANNSSLACYVSANGALRSNVGNILAGCGNDNFLMLVLAGSLDFFGVGLIAVCASEGLNACLTTSFLGGNGSLIPLVSRGNNSLKLLCSNLFLGRSNAADRASICLYAILFAGCGNGVSLILSPLVAGRNSLVAQADSAILTSHLCNTLGGAGLFEKNTGLCLGVSIGIDLSLATLYYVGIAAALVLTDHFGVTGSGASGSYHILLIVVLKSSLYVTLFGSVATRASIQSITLLGAVRSNSLALYHIVAQSLVVTDFLVGNVIATRAGGLYAISCSTSSSNISIGEVVAQSLASLNNLQIAVGSIANLASNACHCGRSTGCSNNLLYKLVITGSGDNSLLSVIATRAGNAQLAILAAVACNNYNILLVMSGEDHLGLGSFLTYGTSVQHLAVLVTGVGSYNNACIPNVVSLKSHEAKSYVAVFANALSNALRIAGSFSQNLTLSSLVCLGIDIGLASLYLLGEIAVLAQSQGVALSGASRSNDLFISSVAVSLNGKYFLSSVAVLASLEGVTILIASRSNYLLVSPLVTQCSGAVQTSFLNLGLATYVTSVKNMLSVLAGCVLQNTCIPVMIGSFGLFLLGLVATRALEGVYAALFTLSANVVLSGLIQNPVVTQSFAVLNILESGLGLDSLTNGADRACLSGLGAGCVDNAVLVVMLTGSGSNLGNGVIASGTVVLYLTCFATSSSLDHSTLIQKVCVDLLVALKITVLTCDLLNTLFFASGCLQNSFHIFMLAFSLFCQSHNRHQRENHQTRQNNGKNSSFHF